MSFKRLIKSGSWRSVHEWCSVTNETLARSTCIATNLSFPELIEAAALILLNFLYEGTIFCHCREITTSQVCFYQNLGYDRSELQNKVVDTDRIQPREPTAAEKEVYLAQLASGTQQ